MLSVSDRSSWVIHWIFLSPMPIYQCKIGIHFGPNRRWDHERGRGVVTTGLSNLG